jgi:hypothetical protein
VVEELLLLLLLNIRDLVFDVLVVEVVVIHLHLHLHLHLLHLLSGVLLFG